MNNPIISNSPGASFNKNRITLFNQLFACKQSQKGWKLAGSDFIDKLKYYYTANTNKLLAVIDTINDYNSKLGHFKYDSGSKASIDSIMMVMVIW